MDRLLNIYNGLLQRVNNKSFRGYKNYGGRGVRCLWNSFEEFKNDMGQSYIHHVDKFGERNTSIDRIDVNGHYCRENCRWATRLEQSYNKRNTTLLTHDGKTLHIKEWSKITGIKTRTIRNRLEYRWTVQESLTTPVRSTSRTYL